MSRNAVPAQLQQILRLPRKMNLMIDPRHIWNVIYNARSNKPHTTTSPNTAPATQNESHDWSASHMKRHLQCAEQAQSASNLTKYCACHEICKFKISAETPWSASANRKDNPRIIRAWNRHLAPAASETLIVRSWRRFCIEKYNISRSGYLPKCHEMLCLPRKVTLQLHQILRLPRKMNLMIDPRHIWNVIYNARSNKPHTTTSPNTAPATQNESHDWSASHMKRHLQCAEQAQSACHEICKFKISAETPWSASANRKTIRADSEDNPRIIRAWNRHLAPAASETLLVPSWRRILYGKIQHFAFRLSPKMSPNAAPATKSDTPTSPNTAPATKSAPYSSVGYFLRIFSLLASILSWHLFSLGIYSLLASILSWHLFSLGIYSLLASILSWHLFSLGIYSLLASILSWHLFSLGIYSLLASIPSWHLFSLGIDSLLASILSWHLFSLGIYSLLASILSWHLFSLGIYSLLASILSWHLFSLGIYSLLASILSWHLFSLGIYSLLASILSWHLFSLGIYSLSIFKTS